MDTVQPPLEFKRNALKAMGISIAICFTLTQNLFISAKDITGITGITPNINYIKTKQE